jgi:site-specific DNA-methyltransferase (adenine-specific)
MINLMLGDCLERMKEIPDGSVDMILADPPYGTTACKWDSVIPLEPMWNELKRIIKPNGAIVLFGSEPFSSFLRVSNINMFRYDWVWEKEQGIGFANANKMPMKKHEVVSVFYKKLPNYYPQELQPFSKKVVRKETDVGEYMGKNGVSNTTYEQKYTNYPTSVLKFSRNKVGTIHLIQKSVVLMEYLIKTYTNKGETVLDFVMGSGTTGVAAKNTGRKFIGIELDNNYFNIAKERINNV